MMAVVRSEGRGDDALAWFRAAVIYLLVAVAIGIAMGVRDDFALRSVHSHLNLLGWVSLALMGLIYQQMPQLGSNRLAKSQFWLHNLGLAGMAAGLSAKLQGLPLADPLLGTGSVALAVAVLLFALNILFLRPRGA
jgi:hypothetical protein